MAVVSSSRECPARRQALLRGPMAAGIAAAGVAASSVVASVVAGVALLPAVAAAAEACWAKPDLRHRAGEEHVAPGVPQALATPPLISRKAIPMPSPFAWRGVLRRVDLPPGQKVVALTFDMCEQPHEVAGYQGRIVDILREHNVKATFFLGGKWMLTHARRAQQLVADPQFEVANHTWEHRNLRLLSGSALDDEILNTQAAHLAVLQSFQGPSKACIPTHKAGPMTLFRFPYGACNPRALHAVEAAGLRAVQWDISSGDPWKGLTSDKMVSDVVKRVHPGSIVLFHANGRGWQTDKALPEIVAQLRAQGYRFATVGEMLQIPGAKPVLREDCYDFKPGDTDRYDTLARSLAIQHDRVVQALRVSRTPRPLEPQDEAGTTAPAKAAAPAASGEQPEPEAAPVQAPPPKPATRPASRSSDQDTGRH